MLAIDCDTQNSVSECHGAPRRSCLFFSWSEENRWSSFRILTTCQKCAFGSEKSIVGHESILVACRVSDALQPIRNRSPLPPQRPNIVNMLPTKFPDEMGGAWGCLEASRSPPIGFLKNGSHIGSHVGFRSDIRSNFAKLH